jgi:hypothetical protein
MDGSASVARDVPDEATAEDIAEAYELLEGFADDVAQRRLRVDADPFHAVKWASAVLWLASDDCSDGVVPPLLNALDDERGVSATKVAQLIPSFVRRMRSQVQAPALSPAPAQRAPAEAAPPAPPPATQADDLF